MAPVRKVVIAGGGTAGWIAAAALSSQLGKVIQITLVESESIATVGVGEATIPTHKAFHRLIGVDEREFMKATRATFKLGIAFENWAQDGDRYIHSFGKIGRSTWMGDFQHLWHYANSQGWSSHIDDYCLELQAAEAGKFDLSEKLKLNYAYHLDASLYAQFLRKLSESKGVNRVEGKISSVKLTAESGEIESICLDSGESLEADFFIDCTGFKGLLISEALKVPFVDWSHWLPMNGAVAVQSEIKEAVMPYTRSIAHKAGWRWRIPLQHRIGNGVVYCDGYMSADEAESHLLSCIDGRLVSSPKRIRFQTGKREHAWYKNCLSLGLSSGFLEPLESTSIHLIQIGITRFIQLFPFDGVSASVQRQYNNQVDEELESIRDFLILHYKLNYRTEPFWQVQANLSVPDSLKHRIDLYKESAIAYQNGADLFRTDSWNQVMRGQGLMPQGYHPMGRLMPDGQLKSGLTQLKDGIHRAVKQMPSHSDFLRQYGVLLEEK